LHLTQVHEIGIRVEDHDRQRGVGDDLLECDAECDAECVRLAGAALTAPEGVPVQLRHDQAERLAGFNLGSES